VEPRSASGLEGVVAVVLAGGLGTRVRHLLPDLPKPMARVAGRPFLEWVTRYLVAQGISKAILSTGYLAEVIEAHFAPQPVSGLTITCFREAEPLGTAGAFAHAAHNSGEVPVAWLVLNGDSLVLADLAAAMSPLRDPATAGVVLGCAVPDAARYGTLALGPGDQLLGFNEKCPGRGLINAGVYLLRDEVVRQFPPRRPLSFEREVFPGLLELGLRIRAVALEAPFLDIGTPESLGLAGDFVRNHLERFCL
jgi:NDP-sugar pyrophosphorylase family protein